MSMAVLPVAAAESAPAPTIGSQAAPAVQRPASTINPAMRSLSLRSYARVVGSYVALSETCGVDTDIAIRADFLAAAGDLTEVDAAAIIKAFDGNYRSYRRRPCNEKMLYQMQAKYQHFMGVLKTD